MNFGRDIVNIISLLMHVNINKWWMIELLKTIYFCDAISLEINQWNVYYFTPVYFVFLVMQVLPEAGMKDRG